MAAILGKLLTKNSQFQMLTTFEPFIRFLQKKKLCVEILVLSAIITYESPFASFFGIMNP
jgi:hypothetical protein